MRILIDNIRIFLAVPVYSIRITGPTHSFKNTSHAQQVMCKGAYEEYSIDHIIQEKEEGLTDYVV